MNLIIYFCMFSVAYGAALSKWEYSGAYGPKKWAAMGGNEACLGRGQSPIVLDAKKSLHLQKLAASPLKYVGYSEPPKTMQLVNDGKTARVNLEGKIRIKGALLKGEYEAVQFHFHWGSRDERGSEHTINGHRFPMEMHIIHANTMYPDLATAAQHRNGTAILAFMFDVVKGGNHNLETLVDGLSNIPYKGESTRLQVFPLNKILPAKMTDYFRYHGSLTTPPCYESVEYVVFPDPIAISETQLNAFRSLNAAPRDSARFGIGKSGHPVKIVNNYRPLQLARGIRVFRNFKNSVRNKKEKGSNKWVRQLGLSKKQRRKLTDPNPKKEKKVKVKDESLTKHLIKKGLIKYKKHKLHPKHKSHKYKKYKLRPKHKSHKYKKYKLRPKHKSHKKHPIKKTFASKHKIKQLKKVNGKVQKMKKIAKKALKSMKNKVIKTIKAKPKQKSKIGQKTQVKVKGKSVRNHGIHKKEGMKVTGALKHKGKIGHKTQVKVGGKTAKHHGIHTKEAMKVTGAHGGHGKHGKHGHYHAEVRNKIKKMESLMGKASENAKEALKRMDG